ncbi:hypothetical protein AaE_007278 [Aphanomyces astaci]|uniref:Uncharacterized protein n=1 Tax=Aphanomyces astaci TaxID=112090 RepID=A0A6A4ZXZ5_APHAT|nr:hypothetical protein AaE_007278 [Aphanomyces astaci]
MKYALYHEVSTEATADDRPGTTTRQEDEPVDEDEETQDVDMPELPPPAKRFKVDEEMPKQPTDDLRQRVTAYLSQVTSEENEESMGQQFYVKDLLTAVNKGQPKRATAKQLGVVLMALEDENKLMYLRDGDDPSIMLV